MSNISVNNVDEDSNMNSICDNAASDALNYSIISDSSQSDKLKMKERQKQNEENFKNLFHQVLDSFQNKNEIPAKKIEEAAIDMINKFKTFDIMDVDFDDDVNLRAYFDRYALTNCSVARHRFLYAFNETDELKNYIIERSDEQNLNIISLGSGPGTDWIGFCSILHEFIEGKNQKITLTNVDLYAKWEEFYERIEDFIKSEHFGNLSEFYRQNNITSYFLNIDLRNESPPAIFSQALQNADIVLLVRVLDELNFKEDPCKIFKNVASKMKKGALLFFMDSLLYKYKDIDEMRHQFDVIVPISCLNGFNMQIQPESKYYEPLRINSPRPEICVVKKRT